MGDSVTASHVGADHVYQSGHRYACPVFKANPVAWIDDKCIVYGTRNLRDTLLRHHVLDYHYKLNLRLEIDHPRYLDPTIFEEIAKCKKTKGSLDDAAIWRLVYQKIKSSSKEDAARQDPYWSPVGLYRTLGSALDMMPDIAQVERGEAGGQNHLPIVRETLTQLQRAEDHLLNVIDGISGQAEGLRDEIRMHMLLCRTKLETIYPGHQSTQSSMSSDQPGDSHSTQGLGTLFLDEHEKTEASLDVDMPDSLHGHGGLVDQDPGHVHQDPFLQWPPGKDNSWYSSQLNQKFEGARQPFHSGSLSSAHRKYQNDQSSNQTTSAPTPSASSLHHSTYSHDQHGENDYGKSWFGSF